MNTYRAMFGIAVASTSLVQGQLVFVPDTNLRNAINAQVPGAVDANGYIDPANPDVIGAEVLYFGVADSTIMDFTGISAFGRLKEMVVFGSSGAEATIPAWPDSIARISLMANIGIPTLPPFPSTLRLLYLHGISQLSSLPTLPNSLDSLSLVGDSSFSVLSSLPNELEYLELKELPLLSSIDSLPLGLERLVLQSLPSLSGIPNFPVAPDAIVIGDLAQLSSVPTWPSRVHIGIGLSLCPQITTLTPLPDSCEYVTLMGMPIVDIPELPIDLVNIYLAELPQLDCLPFLPASTSSVELVYTPIQCLPNYPLNCPYVYIDGAAVPTGGLPLCSPLGSCPTAAALVSGAVYLDPNANGQHDPGEPLYPLANLEITPGPIAFGAGVTGEFYQVLEPGNYTLTCSTSATYALSVTPSIHNVVLPGAMDIDSLNDFGIVLQPGIEDLTVLLTAAPAVPGFDNTVWLSYRNVGTVPMDGSVTFTVDANQSFLSSSTAPDMQMGNTLTWDFVALAIGETRSVAIQVHTDASAPIGTTLLHSAMIDPLLTDQTPADNSAALADVVVGSYDPNDKHVLPTEATPAEVAAGLDLAYTIRFQNTGNWPASRVIITDTLSTDLQWSTFQFTASSHACTWYAQNGVAVFTFDPIYLPDSGLDEPGSHGFVKFRIEPVNSLLNGAAVVNEANIYFDFNPPVITEQCVFSVNTSVGVPEVQSAAMLVYPNPAEDMLNVVLDEAPAPGTVIHVRDVTGRVVLRAPMRSVRTELPIKTLRAGAYRLEVVGGTERWNAGFIKR